MKAAAKPLVYLVLLTGAALFVLPFAWMVLTALKPVDQALGQPHAWLPLRFEAPLGGRRVEVRTGDRVVEPSVVALQAFSARPVVLPARTVWDGAWHPATGAPLPIKVLREIPASPAAPWREILSVSGGESDVVPESAIDSHVSFRWENFPRAVASMRHFWRYLANTLIVCVLNVIGTVLSSAVVAYGFARIEWRGRDRLFALLLATMMIPFPVVMVPLYGLYRHLGMVGTLQPLWVGSFFSSAFSVFLLRQFFRTIPQELTEAARIDGCGEFRIFWQVVLPLCKPALVVVGLFTFLGAWNDFLGPLIYLTDEHDFTLALGLEAMKTSQSGASEWPYLMAASTLVILPVITLFFLAQKSFIEGIALTGTKA